MCFLQNTGLYSAEFYVYFNGNFCVNFQLFLHLFPENILCYDSANYNVHFNRNIRVIFNLYLHLFPAILGYNSAAFNVHFNINFRVMIPADILGLYINV